MKSLAWLTVVAILFLKNHAYGFHVGSPHIIGGRDTQPHAHPYQVLLTFWLDSTKMIYCGGSLLSAEWILTAAHCVSSQSYTSVRAKFGAHQWSASYNGEAEDRPVEKIIIHPHYVPSQAVKNDIALVRVAPLKLVAGIIEPVRLPSVSQRKQTFVGSPVTITGWGRTSDESGPAPTLQSVSSVVLSNEDCARQFKIHDFAVTIDYICSSGAGRKGICQGDSGGPMVIKEQDGNYTLIGVSSFTSEDGCENSLPSGFTRVTFFLDWIHKQTGLKPRI